MGQEPKKRHSRARQGKRRASINLGIPSMVTCTNCGEYNAPHTVCKRCGYYRGQEVMAMSKTKTLQNEDGK